MENPDRCMRHLRPRASRRSLLEGATIVVWSNRSRLLSPAPSPLGGPCNIPGEVSKDPATSSFVARTILSPIESEGARERGTEEVGKDRISARSDVGYHPTNKQQTCLLCSSEHSKVTTIPIVMKECRGEDGEHIRCGPVYTPEWIEKCTRRTQWLPLRPYLPIDSFSAYFELAVPPPKPHNTQPTRELKTPETQSARTVGLKDTQQDIKKPLGNFFSSLTPHGSIQIKSEGLIAQKKKTLRERQTREGRDG